MKSGTTFHIGATKRYIEQAIYNYGAKEVLEGWTGTDAEALKELADDPREIFCGCDCLKDERGACTGEKAILDE
jgi:hypothetical protein